MHVISFQMDRSTLSFLVKRECTLTQYDMRGKYLCTEQLHYKAPQLWAPQQRPQDCHSQRESLKNCMWCVWCTLGRQELLYCKQTKCIQSLHFQLTLSATYTCYHKLSQCVMYCNNWFEIWVNSCTYSVLKGMNTTIEWWNSTHASGD